MRAPIWILAVLVSAPVLAETGEIDGVIDAFPSKYLAETVIYLKDQKGMTFLPRVLNIAAGDTVTFVNSDALDHNVLSRNVEPYDLGIVKKGESREHTFKKPGIYVQQCSVHPEMLAYIFVHQSVYSAVVARNGTWKIGGVPPGRWTVAVWNPNLQANDQMVQLAAKESAQVRFRLE